MAKFFKSKDLAAAFSFSSKATLRRERDRRIAMQLVEGGITSTEIYTASELVAVDIEANSNSVHSLGRLLRKWNGFHAVGQVKRAKLTDDYRRFCRDIGEPEAIQLVLRNGIKADENLSLREQHAVQSVALGRVLQYAQKKFPSIRVDLVAAEIGPTNAGLSILEWHFHLLLRVTTSQTKPHTSLQSTKKTILKSLLAYLHRAGWLTPRPLSEHSPRRSPGDQAYYVAKGLSYFVDRMEEQGEPRLAPLLAMVFRQTRGIALVRARGDFRHWRSAREKELKLLRQMKNASPKHPTGRKPFKALRSRQVSVIGVDRNYRESAPPHDVLLALIRHGTPPQAVRDHIYYSYTSLYPRNWFEALLKDLLSQKRAKVILK
jgi:hypothetical protein